MTLGLLFQTALADESDRSVPFYLEAESGGADIDVASTSVHPYDGRTPEVNMQYSLDGVKWYTIISYGHTVYGGKSIHLNAGQRIYFRAADEIIRLAHTAYRKDAAWHFISEDPIRTGGNILSLLYHDFSDKTTFPDKSDANFAGLFLNCKGLTDASALLLPTETAPYCYESLFEGCTSLVNPPELPATHMEYLCYGSMFEGCTALETAPELPNINLDDQYCSEMFRDCTSLNTIRVAFTSWGSHKFYGTRIWTRNVAPTGTFYCPEKLSARYDESHIPTGWTVVRTTGSSTLGGSTLSGGNVWIMVAAAVAVGVVAVLIKKKKKSDKN